MFRNMLSVRFGFLLLLLTFVPVFSDTESGAPKTGERVLLVYCDFKTWPEFGYNAMETFKSALEGSSGAPSFSPLPSVDIVKITNGADGIIDEVLTAFGGEIADSLKGGGELRHWTQVYDLRFRNATTGKNEDFITIDIDDPVSDYSLYKTLLENGGGLFVQGEYSMFLGRNMGVATLINLLTNDQFKKENISDLGFKNITEFPTEPEGFATDFQNLNSGDPLKLVHAGAYPMNKIEHGLPLISSGDNAHMLFWYSKDLQVQNGRMIVSFDINGWADKKEGEINATTYASVQNIYDLLSGVKNYTVEKSFVPDRADVGDDATFRIYCTNSGKSDLVDFTVIDTVHPCLTVTGATPLWESKKEIPDVGTVLEWTVTIGQGNRDSIVVDFNVNAFPGQ